MRRWVQNQTGGQPSLSVVVAAYNRPRELLLALAGYLRQSDRNFELILADDGSRPEIEDFFKAFGREAPFPTTYLWQEDRGWGKPRMLNWAILEARGEVVCFTDADCIPHRHFVRSHAQEARDKTVQCGRRVDLMEKISPAITAADIERGCFDSAAWMAEKILKGEVDFGHQGFFLPKFAAQAIHAFTREPTLLGSNMSVHKKRLLEVNGFDECFTVPGIGEDTDMQRRFGLAGLEVRWITYRAIQYHLWHPLTPVGKEAHKIFESLKARNNKAAVKGIREFLPQFESAFSGSKISS